MLAFQICLQSFAVLRFADAAAAYAITAGDSGHLYFKAGLDE